MRLNHLFKSKLKLKNLNTIFANMLDFTHLSIERKTNLIFFRILHLIYQIDDYVNNYQYLIYNLWHVKESIIELELIKESPYEIAIY